MENFDVIILGAGAAGLMCASQSAKRKRKTLVLDHANKPGKKILMSGGGRCNFTNLNIQADNFISHNPHFCKSALNRYTQWDFIDLVNSHNIPFHEKTLGQLFCDNKSKDILDMLLIEMQCDLRLQTQVEKIEKLNDDFFKLKTSRGDFQCESLVIATGGLSIPTMGASPFGYKVAEQFGIKVWPVRAGLVALTLHEKDKEKLSTLSGISADCIVSNERIQFKENLLFTHRGLSGPAILQMSSYWESGEAIEINLLPHIHLNEKFKILKATHSQKQIKTILTEYLPQRIVETFIENHLQEKKLIATSKTDCEYIAKQLNHWRIKPNGTEGYRTAEVTLGGVDCHAVSSKTMASHDIPGLYFIGEVLDVTGWLGGYNFQWAWSSGWACGQVC